MQSRISKSSSQISRIPSEKPAPLSSDESKEKYMSLVRKGIIQIKLPRSFPPMFHTWDTFKDGRQKDVSLLYKKEIEATLKYLHESVKPIARKFELYYSLFTEGHPSIVGHAFTKKLKVLVSSPLEQEKEYLTTYHVYIKLRNPEKPNDKRSFLNATTAMAIMLHELAHLRCYDHSFNFALLLRDIFKAAMKLKLFPVVEEPIQIPSRRSWERVLFEKKGNMTDEELRVVYDDFLASSSAQGDDDSLDMGDPTQPDTQPVTNNKMIEENQIIPCKECNNHPQNQQELSEEGMKNSDNHEMKQQIKKEIKKPPSNLKKITPLQEQQKTNQTKPKTSSSMNLFKKQI